MQVMLKKTPNNSNHSQHVGYLHIVHGGSAANDAGDAQENPKQLQSQPILHGGSAANDAGDAQAALQTTASTAVQVGDLQIVHGCRRCPSKLQTPTAMQVGDLQIVHGGSAANDADDAQANRKQLQAQPCRLVTCRLFMDAGDAQANSKHVHSW